MNRRVSSLLLLVVLAARAGALPPGITDSKHNLSAGRPGALTASISGGSTSSEVCVFCHTPHTAGKEALWNRSDAGVVYTPYQSSTTKARVGQPTGSSKLCLSCHDGTVALGRVRSRAKPIAMKSAAGTIPKGPSNLGTDLSDDHPVSFKFDASLVAANGQLTRPAGSKSIHLDASGELQCTSCHDPHNDRNGKFLVMDNSASALCVSCHKIRDWSQSSHGLSGRTWNGQGVNPWPHTAEKTVAANGCENCHNPHGAGGRQRLLNEAPEEQNCFPCHNGNAAAKNIQAEFRKISTHPVARTMGVHDPMEPDLVSNSGGRHVECADCHNPHATAAAGGGASAGVSGTLNGVRGVSSSGANVSQVQNEYELCFRCHGDTAAGPARVNRQYPQLNTRVEFQGSGVMKSFHPVVMTGRNTYVPSLKPPLTTSSLITCSDCHNSDAGPQNGGAGPNGPHGSAYPPLLERSLSFANAPATTANSALCFKCHDFVNTAWPKHLDHIRMTSCMTCHDPHGAPNQHLINFDPGLVKGAREYQSTGLNRVGCSLSCHGKDHSLPN